MKQDATHDIEQLGSALLALIKGQGRLLALEAALAKQSILPLIASTVCLMILTVTTWLGCLVFITYLGYEWTQDLGISIIITLCINISLWLIMIFNVMRYKKRIQFTKTWDHMKQWMSG